MAQLYTSNYANNVPNMSNSELVGMAKNRYTDAETMEAISKGYYRLAKEYLAENPNITPAAAQELWNHRGYVFKAVLLSKGTIKLKKKEYAEVYRKYFKNNTRSHWRMMSAFLGSHYYWQPGSDKSNTPGELLEEIFADLAPEEMDRTYTLRKFINHRNCPLNLALKIGTIKTPENARQYYTDDFERLRNDAMLKVAEITKRESADSR
jgi:hypothetical protein